MRYSNGKIRQINRNSKKWQEMQFKLKLTLVNEIQNIFQQIN